MTLELKRVFGDKPLVGAELGVFEGKNAESMLRQLNIQRLYLVDPYEPYSEYHDLIIDRLKVARAAAQKRLAPFADSIIWLCMKSSKAIGSIGEELDFVYIDANHAYDYVKCDIEAYYDLVRPGGYVGGHDYTTNLNLNNLIEVKRAVDEFVIEHGYKVVIRPRDSSDRWPDWWVRKWSEGETSIHFIWLGPAPLIFPDYLAVRTACEVYSATPFLWTDGTVPENEWLLKIKSIASQRRFEDAWTQLAGTARLLSHKIDYLRYQLLNDFGGLCLDTDTLCLKSIFDLDLNGVVVGRESSSYLNGAVMYANSPGHPIVKSLLGRTTDMLRARARMPWSRTGPFLLTEVMSAAGDFTILPQEFFYFYGFRDWEQIFKDNPIDDRMYVIHWWNKLAAGFVRNTVDPSYIETSNCLYARAARRVLGSNFH